MPKILSIEDSEFERKTIKKILEKEGYTDVFFASNGEDGLKKFHEENPDILLLDLRLPDMDGEEILEELSSKNVDIIIVSIVREDETINEMKEKGAKGYVVKPITKDKLIPQIEKLL